VRIPLTCGVSFVREIRSVAYGARHERAPESTTLLTFVEPRQINVLRKTAVLKFVFEFFTIDVILILEPKRDHQIIVSVWSMLLATLASDQAMQRTNQRILVQYPTGSLLNRKTVSTGASKKRHRD
jgi:hypothetical protein